MGLEFVKTGTFMKALTAIIASSKKFVVRLIARGDRRQVLKSEEEFKGNYWRTLLCHSGLELNADLIWWQCTRTNCHSHVPDI